VVYLIGDPVYFKLTRSTCVGLGLCENVTDYAVKSIATKM